MCQIDWVQCSGCLGRPYELQPCKAFVDRHLSDLRNASINHVFNGTGIYIRMRSDDAPSFCKDLSSDGPKRYCVLYAGATGMSRIKRKCTAVRSRLSLIFGRSIQMEDGGRLISIRLHKAASCLSCGQIIAPRTVLSGEEEDYISIDKVGLQNFLCHHGKGYKEGRTVILSHYNHYPLQCGKIPHSLRLGHSQWMTEILLLSSVETEDAENVKSVGN